MDRGLNVKELFLVMRDDKAAAAGASLQVLPWHEGLQDKDQVKFSQANTGE